MFLIAFFPIAVNLTTGLLLVDADLMRLMRSYRATGWHIFRTVRVPNALPFFLVGLRIAVALAVVGAVVAEFVGADRGLGYLILLANAELRTPLLFACLVWLGGDRRRALRAGALARAVALTVGSGPPRP